MNSSTLFLCLLLFPQYLVLLLFFFAIHIRWKKRYRTEKMYHHDVKRRTEEDTQYNDNKVDNKKKGEFFFVFVNSEKNSSGFKFQAFFFLLFNRQESFCYSFLSFITSWVQLFGIFFFLLFCNRLKATITTRKKWQYLILVHYHVGPKEVSISFWSKTV